MAIVAGLQLEQLEFRSPLVTLSRQAVTDALNNRAEAGLLVSPVWQRRLSEIWKFLDGLNSGGGDSVALALLADVGQQNQRAVDAQESAAQALAQMPSVRDYRSEIEEIRRLIVGLPEPRDWSKEISDLQVLVATQLQSAPLPQDLSTGASPTFAGLTLSGLTAKSVLFAGAGGLVSEDNANFQFDSATHILTVKHVTVAGTLTAPTITAAGAMTISNTGGADLAIITGGDLVLTPTGDIKYGTFSAAGAETFNGTIPWKTADGTVRKVAIFA